MKKLSRSQWQVVSPESSEACLVIRNIGDDCISVTNNVENVVANLVRGGFLPEGQRLMYYDSDGALDEICVANGSFGGFIPGPGR